MSETRVFVSSTCYDLIHIRQALNTHISELGHRPVMSEFSTFRVDPHLSSLENCRDNVRANADVFVLIIGGRRGSFVQSSGKSIVNMEYDVAVDEGLDIYVFVDQAVLTLLPIWHKNKEVDLNPTVDSNDVLSFIDKIRGEQRWTFGFTKENDIFQILSLQLSGQFRELLSKRRSGALNAALLFRDEGSIAIELVRSKEPFWEFLLSAELIEGRVRSARRKLENIRLGRVLGPHSTLSGRLYMDWVASKFPELSCTLQKIQAVFEEDIVGSWGPPGVQGDPKAILSAAKELQTTLEAVVSVESDIYRTHGPAVTDPVREAMLGMTDDFMDPLQTGPDRLRALVEEGRAHKPADESLRLNLNLKFEFKSLGRFNAAMDAMRGEMTREDWL